MLKFVLLIIIIIFLIFIINTKRSNKENFNSIYESRYARIQNIFENMPNINSEDLIITNTINIPNINVSELNFYKNYDIKNIKNIDNIYNLKQDDDKLSLSNKNNLILFDSSGNCDISNNISNQNNFNTLISDINAQNLNLNNKIKVKMLDPANVSQVITQNNFTLNNSDLLNNYTSQNLNSSVGIRVWTQQMYPVSCKEQTYDSPGRTTGCKTYQYGDILLVDQNGTQYDSDKWIVIAVGHKFTGSDATGVYTYIYNNKWYGSCSGGSYLGTFMVIPKNYFDDTVNLNSLTQTSYNGYPYS
jgi:hypothetical protein